MLNAKAWSLAGVVGAVLAAGATAPASAAMISFETVALTGDAAPGTGGATFRILGPPTLNDSGDSAFLGILTGAGVTGSNDRGIFAQSGGALGLVAREGDTAPDTGGAAFADSFSVSTLNNNGDIAFFGGLTGAGVTRFTNGGIFAQSGGALGLVARQGDTAPGTGGAAFSGFSQPALNDDGDTAFVGALTGTGVTSSNNRGVFTDSGGTLGLVARTGDAAPGTGGAVFSLFNTPVLNNSGDTAFTANLAGAGVTGANSGIFAQSAGVLGLVAREGDAAPGTGGAAFSGLGNPALNDDGDTAFVGALTGTGVTGSNNTGIFAERGGVLGLVAREGDTAPGTGGAAFALFDVPGLNDDGDIAFTAILTGAGVTGSNSLWFGANGGPLELIVRTGDLLEVAPGDGRIVAEFFVFSFNSGFFNNADQVGFLAVFSDGSEGVFVATVDGVTAVPAPGSVAVLAAGLAGLALLRRRRPQAA